MCKARYHSGITSRDLQVTQGLHKQNKVIVPLIIFSDLARNKRLDFTVGLLLTNMIYDVTLR